MNQKIILKSLLLTATASLGLAAAAVAADATSPAVPTGATGLLGQTYASMSYSYSVLSNSPVNAAGYSFEYNQPLNTGFDAVFNYDWAQSGTFAGSRAHDQSLTASLRAFCVSLPWGKPYVDVGAGYEWQKYAGTQINSFVWRGAAGVEFAVTPKVTVTPFVQYDRTNSFADHDTVTYGVKANYWLTQRWSVSGALTRDDRQNLTYKLGFNARF